MSHRPVLLHEVVEGMEIVPGLVVLDCTLGAGGHSRAIADRIGPSGVLVGLDRDADAIERAGAALAGTSAKVHLVNRSYRELDVVLAELGITSVDRVLFDLGLSSDQLEVSGRGFSFQKDEPLVMTFSKNPGESAVTARDVVNDWSEETLADILYGFGGERNSRKIARSIVLAREVAPIETTKNLAEIIEAASPRRGAKIHPATRTFQAIRIAVNDELGAVREGLEKAWRVLAPGGKLLVISFHSLEDRIVKTFAKECKTKGEGEQQPKKVITPTREEEIDNPRSRSAVLRIICKND